MGEKRSTDGELSAEIARLRRRVAKLESEPRSTPSLRSALASAADLIITLDRDHRVLFVNRDDEAAGDSVFSLIDPSGHAAARACFERVRATGEASSYEETTRARHLVTSVAPIVEEGRTEGFVLVVRDVTEAKLSEIALRSSEERLRLAFEATNMGLYSWEIAGDDFRLDERGCRIYGFDPAKPPTSFAEVLERVHPDDRGPVKRTLVGVLRDGPPLELEWRIVGPDGATHWLLSRSRAERDADGAIVRLYGGILDMTRLKELEGQLRQSQKMEAVGQLTAGIAHNFNNMLAAIVSNLALAERRSDAEVRRFLVNAGQASSRAADLVRQLMVFSSSRSYARRLPCPVRDIVTRTVEFCRPTFERYIHIDVSFEDDLPAVEADSTQLEQALLNVCINARDAMLSDGDAHRHELRITVDRVAAESIEIASRADALPRDHIRIQVSDTGPGIDEATRRRIFEPFFTTKEVGKGTGLGLSTAFAIVADHDGWLECDAGLGPGAVFTFYLPVCAPADATLALTPAPHPSAGGELRGTVLLVDDEELIRSSVSQLLLDEGYEVRTAASSEEAIAVLSSGDDIDLVLLDYNMPILSGLRILPRLREIAPGVPVVVFTGYPGAVGEMVEGVVRKPVKTTQLLEMVRRTLDTRRDQP